MGDRRAEISLHDGEALHLAALLDGNLRPPGAVEAGDERATARGPVTLLERMTAAPHVELAVELGERMNWYRKFRHPLPGFSAPAAQLVAGELVVFSAVNSQRDVRAA